VTEETGRTVAPGHMEEAEFFRWYGAWAPLDPGGLADLMSGFSRPWWIVGGWAIEAFTGLPREHEDVDLSILACDAAHLREHLGSEWCLWSNDSGMLRPLNDRYPELWAPDCQVWIRRDAQSPWLVDVPVTPDRDGLWTSKRWGEHVVPLEEATWVAPDGIRYSNPEIALHYKARSMRLKDERDLDVTWPLLSTDQRAWLLRAIEVTEGPDHPWLGRRSREE
jgi:hypothetical protein